MAEKPAKMMKRYSKTTLALSDPPRCPKVDISETDPGGNMQVSGPIARRIEKLYHKDSTPQSKKKPTDEKHPVVLKNYERGVSDTAVIPPVRKYSKKRRPYHSLDDTGTPTGQITMTSGKVTPENVQISMRNGEMLVFNESLEAFEVQDLSPTEEHSVNLNYRSLPTMTGNNIERMTQMTFYSDKGTSCGDIKKCEADLRKEHSSEAFEGYSDKSPCQTRQTDGNDSYRVESDLYFRSINDNVGELDTSLPSVEDIVNSDSDNEECIFKDHSDENSVHSDTEEDKNTKPSKKSQYVTTGPALRKIDRYRESLKRRKNNNRSSSVPEHSQQIFYQPATASTPKPNENTAKERKYVSKSAERPRSISHFVIKSTPVSRSNSLGRLNLFGSNIEDIPKGIAKQKISELQRKVDEEEKRKREELVKSPTLLFGVTSPRSNSPAVANSPRYRTLSPTTSVRNNFFFTTNTLMSKSSDRFAMGKSNPVSKEDAVNILQNMIPKTSPANSPRSGELQKELSRYLQPDEIKVCSQREDVLESEYPTPAPRRNSKQKKNRIENVKKSFELSDVVHGSSSSVSSFSSTQSSADDGYDKTTKLDSSVPIRPHRGVKRPSEKLEASPTLTSKQLEARTTKVPYTQVVSPRKKGPAMGVSSFRRHSKGPAPQPPGTNEKKTPPLERQMEFEECSKNDVSLMFVPGKSDQSDTGNNLSDDTNDKLNLIGVTEDSSCDFEEILKDSGEPHNIQDHKSQSRSDSTDHLVVKSSFEKCILPAPQGFSDDTGNEDCELYAVINKTLKTKREAKSQPVPPPRLKKSTSLTFPKQDINGNEESNESISHEESEDTSIPTEPQNNTDYSSSEDLLDDNYERYDPSYETIGDCVSNGRPYSLDVANNNNNKPSDSDTIKINQHAVTVDETVKDPVFDISPKANKAGAPKVSKSKKKDKKKNKKRHQSVSPGRVVVEASKFSSDEDLLEERSRRRTMSPTAVAKDFKDTVKKMLRVRPGSPKDKAEKCLSPHEPNTNSHGNGKKAVATKLGSTGYGQVPGEGDGVTLLSIKRSATEDKVFHIDFDSNSGQLPCHHCEQKGGGVGGHFDVNRYAGNNKRKASAKNRASKSMGDIYENMDKLSREALEDLSVAHIDPPLLGDGVHRRLPATPRKRGVPILVKILGKDDAIECQFSECGSGHMQAVKICHHTDCQDCNGQQPLLLCHACDKHIHTKPDYNGHLRFDVFKKGGNLQRNVSTRSLPGGLTRSDDEGGGDATDQNTESDLKKNSSKLKRKKAMKKRYHTDECDANSELLRIRSASLQEGLHGHLQKSHSAGVILQTKDTSQSEPSIERRPSNDQGGQNDSEAVIGLRPHLDSQEALVSEGSDISRNDTDNKVLFSQSAESLQNKSSESSQDIDLDGDEEFSSILNSSPTRSSQNRHTSSLESKEDVHIIDSEPIYRQLPEHHGQQARGSLPLCTRDSVDSPVRNTLLKTPQRRNNKEDTSKKNMGMEFFTLKFDLLDDPDVYEIVAAVKGVSLKDAVSSCLDRRGIDVNLVDIFLASSNTALPLQVDCFPLGGNHLHVKAKENESLLRFSRSVSTQSLNSSKHSRLAQPVKQTKQPLIIYIRRDQHTRSSLPPPHTLDPPVVHHRRTSLRPRSAVNSPYKTEPHPLVGLTVVPHLKPHSDSDSSDQDTDTDDSGREEEERPQQTQKGKRLLGTVDDTGSGGSSNVSVGDVSVHSTNSLSSADSTRSKTLKPPTKLGMLFSSSPFAKNQEKHDFLLTQLENYSKDGLPSMPSLLTLGKPRYDEATFTLESHWSQVGGVNPEQLTKKQRDQQMSIWELLCTEVEHVRKLNVIIDLFYCCLMDLQNEGLLNEVRTEEVFSNIVDVCDCNQEFWANHLIQVVEHAREHKTLLDPSLLKEAFMKFDEIFKPYAKYCLEQRACVDYIRLKQSDNELFRMFIEWAEAQKQCNRLKLQDLVIIPMQRLTKYKLLLVAILAKTDKEEHRKDLRYMIEKVEKFVLQVNQVMHQRAEHERLKMIIDRIEVYDVIDTPNIEEVQRLAGDFCKLDLTCPVPGCGPQQRRHLLLEGGLKFREANSRLDVYCFLFTDMLLITKPNKKGDKVKVTKPPMRLDKCVVQLLRDGSSFMLVYLNEYHVATGIYTFHGDAAKIWVDHVRRAQEAYKQLRKKALENSENRMYWEMFYEENYEDDLAVLNPRHQSGEVHEQPDGGFESFMPNSDSMSRSNSHGALKFDPNGQDSRKLRISSSLDENQVFKNAGRESVTRSDSEPSRIPLSLPRQSISDYGSGEYVASTPVNRSTTQPDVYFTSKPSGGGSGGVKSRPQSASRTDSQSSGEVQLVRPAHRPKQHRELPQRPLSSTTSTTTDEQHKGKLNQRRTRNEKRYHTADAIQELRKDSRDASIHKRLSWNLGSQQGVDIHSLENKHLNKKAFSSDSIRSMPSSSGVSSTGSLHLSPETEICEEEYEEEDEEDEGHDSALIDNLSIPSTEGGYTLTLLQEVGSHSDSSTNESSATLTAEHQLDGASASDDSGSGDFIVSSNQAAFSKSMPDISQISVRDVRNGVASAELSKSAKKMSHRELLNMKKQLLLNSTIEASEV